MNKSVIGLCKLQSHEEILKLPMWIEKITSNMGALISNFELQLPSHGVPFVIHESVANTIASVEGVNNRDENSAKDATLALLVKPLSTNYPVTKPKRKKRHPPSAKPLKPFTDVETNTLTAVAKHCGNIAAAAKDLDRHPKTVKENYDRGMKKAHIMRSRSIDTVRLPQDQREISNDNK